jgi:hypothetical protein
MPAEVARNIAHRFTPYRFPGCIINVEYSLCGGGNANARRTNNVLVPWRKLLLSAVSEEEMKLFRALGVLEISLVCTSCVEQMGIVLCGRHG